MKRFVVTEEEKNRIRGLYETETPDVTDVNTYPECVKRFGKPQLSPSGKQWSIVGTGNVFGGYRFYNTGKVLKPKTNSLHNYSCQKPSQLSKYLHGTILIDGKNEDLEYYKNNPEKENFDYLSHTPLSGGYFQPKPLDPHDTLTILQIGVMLIPVVGPIISRGLGFYEAKLYWDKGKKEEAIVVAAFGFIPGIKSIYGRVRVTSEAMTQLAEDIIKRKALDLEQTQIVKDIIKNKDFIIAELKKYFQNTKSAVQ